MTERNPNGRGDEGARDETVEQSRLDAVLGRAGHAERVTQVVGQVVARRAALSDARGHASRERDVEAFGQGFSERPHRFEQRDAGRGHV